METNEPRLRVRCGEQVFGPMSVADLAELLAAGRFSGSDLVSEPSGPWVTIEEYVAGQSEAPPSAPQPTSADDDFLCVPEPATPIAERQMPPPEDDEPLVGASEGGPDSDYILESGADASDYVPLSESLDPASSGSGESSSSGQPDLYRFPRPEPPKEPPPPEPLESMPPVPSRRSHRSAELPMPLPDESELDDVLQALARDEEDAPELKPRKLKRSGSKDAGRGRPKRPKRR
jgi:hypothetical protein